jgi:hypothetical protein
VTNLMEAMLRCMVSLACAHHLHAVTHFAPLRQRDANSFS